MDSAPSTPAAASAASAAVPDAPAGAYAFSPDPLKLLEGKQISFPCLTEDRTADLFKRPDSLLGKRGSEAASIEQLDAEVRSLRRVLNEKETHIEYLREMCESMEETLENLKAEAESLKKPVRRILRSRDHCKDWIKHQKVNNALQMKRQRDCSCRPPATGGAWSVVDDVDYFAKQEADVAELKRAFVQNYACSGYDSESEKDVSEAGSDSDDCSDDDETLSESERREAARDREAASDFLSAVREVDAQCAQMLDDDDDAIACVGTLSGDFRIVRKA